MITKANNADGILDWRDLFLEDEAPRCCVCGNEINYYAGNLINTVHPFEMCCHNRERDCSAEANAKGLFLPEDRKNGDVGNWIHYTDG